MEDLQITLLQSSLVWENKKANLENFRKKIIDLKEKTDVIVLPEMFSTGFSMNTSALAETMQGPTIEWMQTLAKAKNCVITGSIIIEEDGCFYNRLIWMQPNGMNHYDKRHLFSLAAEEESYTAGKHQWIMVYKGWKIFPLICYDLRFPVWSRRQKKLDYDLLLYVANWPEKRIHAWKQLLIARAIENQSYVAGVNRVGNDGHQITHTGESSIIDYKGETLLTFEPNTEKSGTTTLNYESMLSFRKHFPFENDADQFQIVSN